MTNWLKTSLNATKDPMKVGRMLTLQEFIRYTEFKVDEYSMNKFYYNLDNELFIYVDNSIIEWFGYTGSIKVQKDQIKKILKKNFSEYENTYWFDYSNKEYKIFYDENPMTSANVIENNSEIYPNPTKFANKTKHMIIHPIIFKHIVLMAKTDKSMEIRDYYITLEELIKKYTQYQSEARNVHNMSLQQLLEDNNIMTTKIVHKLDESGKKLDDISKKFDKTDKKLDLVLPQRVEIDMATDPDVPQVYILHDRDSNVDEYNLYVMRCQSKSYESRIKKIKNKYGDNIHRIYTVKQPNAVIFWRNIKKELIDNLDLHNKSNWFSLKDMTIRQFKERLNYLDKKRKDK
jgi:phage anti-repressor protein